MFTVQLILSGAMDAMTICRIQLVSPLALLKTALSLWPLVYGPLRPTNANKSQAESSRVN